MNSNRPSGQTAFFVVWSGQAISLLGSGMTAFATMLWAYQLTGKATSLALIAFFQFGPTIIFGPIAGALIDRWNRKLTMAISDLATGVLTMVLLVLYLTGNLQLWHLYAVGALGGVFQTFQWPAYTAAMSTMLPSQSYTRANGMVNMVYSGTAILTPILAGILLGPIGLSGILIIDVITFVIALGGLLLIHVPQPPPSPEGLSNKGSLWKEVTFGFRYVFDRPSLLGLQLVFLIMNLVNNLGVNVRQAFVLVRTGNSAAILASVLSAAAFGSLVGSTLMSVWKGPKRRIDGVLAGMVLHGLIGGVVFGLGQTQLTWAVAAFGSSFFMAILSTSSSAIWQSKVPPDLQGRIFSTRRMLAHAAVPISMLIAGPLADNVLEPAMMENGGLASIFGNLLGRGPGAGMGLMIMVAGAVSALTGLSGYASESIRNTDKLLPDHDAEAKVTA